MNPDRLEAFSDGVIAILITIMVLELKVPHEPTLAALRDTLPMLFNYLLAFVYLGIYWNNHHHLLAATDRISGAVMWANMHLLFWLSLVPFIVAWMGENQFAGVPTAALGLVLFCAALAFTILVRAILATPGNKRVAAAIGTDTKGKVSLFLYAAAIQ